MIYIIVYSTVAFTEPKMNEQPQFISAAIKKLQKADEEDRFAVLANATHSKLTEMFFFLFLAYLTMIIILGF